MKQHIYPALILQRRRLGLSQAEVAARAGLRREKVNRVESRREDISLEEMSRLLDAVGLVLEVREKSEAMPSPAGPRSPLVQQRHLLPQEFGKASFIDGSRAKVLSWGKVPK